MSNVNPNILRELHAIETLLKQRGLTPPKPLLKRKRLLPADADQLNTLRWSMRYRRINGKPFSLDLHKPLTAIYADDHPHIVVLKPSQVGISEFAVSKTLHALDVGAVYYQTGLDGLNVAYLFPTGKALSDFSKERFSGVVNEHAHIRDLFAHGFDDVTFKQAGNSYLYLRSAWIGGRGKNRAGENLLSFPADVLILDEFDRMDPAAVELARKRLRASSVRREIDISTPTIPGYGIHALYLQSDQCVWEVPCPLCQEWLEMTFFRDMHGQRADDPAPQPYDGWKTWDRETITQAQWFVLCPACHSPVDRAANGRWVARNPTITSLRGYHVPTLAFPMVKLHELATAATSSDPTVIEEFFRSDLGLPYAVEGSSITEPMLDALVGIPPAGSHSRITMGVDVGARFHYRISAQGTEPKGQRVILAMGSVGSWDDLDDLMTRYRVSRCIIDAQPELHGAKKWAATWKGKVLRAFYPDGKRVLAGELFRVDTEEGIIQINRTMAMDALVARITDAPDEGTEVWPHAVIANQEVRSHMMAPKRVVVKDAVGNPVVHWVHTLPDHYFHASLYDEIARQVKPKERAGGALVQGAARGWSPPG